MVWPYTPQAAIYTTIATAGAGAKYATPAAVASFRHFECSVKPFIPSTISNLEYAP